MRNNRLRTQDEIYVIVRGRGILVHDGERHPFAAGEMMFVATRTEHHFEDFTEDLAVWVVFYGPLVGRSRHRARYEPCQWSRIARSLFQVG